MTPEQALQYLLDAGVVLDEAQMVVRETEYMSDTNRKRWIEAALD